MIKVKGEKDVVLMMSQREFDALYMLVAAGVCHVHCDKQWSDEDITRFRTIRDDMEE